jgi:uncharacterized protein
VSILHDLLKNKIVLITGASSGIGRCIANDFSRFQLKSLILIARNQSKLSETASSIKQNFEILPISCDVSRKDEVKHLGKDIHDRYGYIDIIDKQCWCWYIWTSRKNIH